MCDDCARERAAREAAERERDAADKAAAAWMRMQKEAESALAAERVVHADTRLAINALKSERNAALELAEKRGAAYDMTWREVESLRERLDKEEEERGRQFGLRVRAEEETERLISLVKEWLDGNARLGRPKSIADQRFLNGLNAEVRDSRQTEKAKDSEPHLRAENERLREALRASVVAMKRWSAEEDGLPEAPIGAHEAVTASEAILGYVWAGCGPDPLRAAAEKKEGERGK